MVNLQTFLGDFVKSVNYEFYPFSQAATIYKHFAIRRAWDRPRSDVRLL